MAVRSALPEKASRTVPLAQGFDGLPLMYPVPLFVRNTFIDHELRSPSLDGFFQQRLVASCPTSLVSDGAGAEEQSLVPQIPLYRVKTCPEAVRQMSRGAAVQAAVAYSDTNSECSTADTAEDVAPVATPHLPLHPHQGAPSVSRLNSSAAPWVSTGAPTVLRLQEIVHPMMTHQMGGAPWPQGFFGEPVCPAPQLPMPMYQAAPDHMPQLPQMPILTEHTGPQRHVDAEFLQEALPSLGSAQHKSGDCKPCAFLHSKGCTSGLNCEFCHMCEPGEKKRRQKEKRAFFSGMRSIRQFVTGGP